MKSGEETSIFEVTSGKASEIRSKVLKRAVASDDPLVTTEIEESARLIGIAVGNVINFLNPEMIVMGGGMIESLADVMMPIIEKTARKCAIANAAQDVQIVASELGDMAGLLGAAALVR
jgi:glucokinase